MRKIYKYSVGELVKVPYGYEVLHGGLQNGIPKVWIAVPASGVTKMIIFKIYGTGWDVVDGDEYICTYQEGNLVWHIFKEEIV